MWHPVLISKRLLIFYLNTAYYLHFCGIVTGKLSKRFKNDMYIWSLTRRQHYTCVQPYHEQRFGLP